MRRHLRGLRQGMRKYGEWQRFYAAMRRRLPQMRGILPKDVFNVGFNVIKNITDQRHRKSFLSSLVGF